MSYYFRGVFAVDNIKGQFAAGESGFKNVRICSAYIQVTSRSIIEKDTISFARDNKRNRKIKVLGIFSVTKRRSIVQAETMPPPVKRQGTFAPTKYLLSFLQSEFKSPVFI